MPTATQSAQLANFRNLAIGFFLRTSRRAGHDLFHDFQQPQLLGLAQLSDPFVIVGDCFPNDLTLRLSLAFGGILQTSDRLFVERKGDLAPCHTVAILPYRYRLTHTLFVCVYFS